MSNNAHETSMKIKQLLGRDDFVTISCEDGHKIYVPCVVCDELEARGLMTEAGLTCEDTCDTSFNSNWHKYQSKKPMRAFWV
ncbi:MAG: hypothetical protein IKP28_02800 [Clostridia bacterium]|nr:hypothetical protein [Clostridia bacterium]